MDSRVEIPKPITAPKKSTYDNQKIMVLVTPTGIEEEKNIYKKLDDNKIGQSSMTHENYLYKFPNGTDIDEDLEKRILDDYNNRRIKEKEKEELKLKQKQQEYDDKLKQQQQQQQEQEEEQIQKTHPINDNDNDNKTIYNTKYFQSIINFLNNNQDVEEGVVIDKKYLKLKKKEHENINIEYDGTGMNIRDFAKNSDGYFKKIGNNKVYINLDKDYWDSELFNKNLSIRPVRNDKIQNAESVGDNQIAGKRKTRRNRKSKKGKKSRKARKSRRKSNRRRGRR